MSESLLRDLKERLEFRGFAISESKDANGWPKLNLNSNEASIRMEAISNVSRDVFGQELVAFSPSRLEFSSRNDAMDSLKVSKILLEVVKMAVDKMVVKSHATDLALAEASDGEELGFNVLWPTKGA